MLATIILDTFQKTEITDIANALDDICSPNDNYGFASAAIYCFWSIDPRDILYIGLAKNVAERFRQHTGLISCDPNCCKRIQIEEYFNLNNRIGYSIIVQSTLEQPFMGNRDNVTDDDVLAAIDAVEGEENIAFGEGLLIKLYEDIASKKPRWNKVHGATRAHDARSISQSNLGAKIRAAEWDIRHTFLAETRGSPIAPEPFAEEERPYHFLENLDGSQLSGFNAKCTLREMADSATFCINEGVLHAARANMLVFGPDFEQALVALSKFDVSAKNRIEFMRESGYLERRLPLII
jgi:hypothetical protein